VTKNNVAPRWPATSELFGLLTMPDLAAKSAHTGRHNVARKRGKSPEFTQNAGLLQDSSLAGDAATPHNILAAVPFFV
jgi:hypothetical protein